MLDEGTRLNITSPNYPQEYHNNAYNFWDIRSPGGLVVLVQLLLFDVAADDGILFGDGVDMALSTGGGVMCPWQRVTNLRKDFVSKSSGIKSFLYQTTSIPVVYLSCN